MDYSKINSITELRKICRKVGYSFNHNDEIRDVKKGLIRHLRQRGGGECNFTKSNNSVSITLQIHSNKDFNQDISIGLYTILINNQNILTPDTDFIEIYFRNKISEDSIDRKVFKRYNITILNEKGIRITAKDKSLSHKNYVHKIIFLKKIINLFIDDYNIEVKNKNDNKLVKLFETLKYNASKYLIYDKDLNGNNYRNSILYYDKTTSKENMEQYFQTNWICQNKYKKDEKDEKCGKSRPPEFGKCPQCQKFLYAPKSKINNNSGKESIEKKNINALKCIADDIIAINTDCEAIDANNGNFLTVPYTIATISQNDNVILKAIIDVGLYMGHGHLLIIPTNEFPGISKIMKGTSNILKEKDQTLKDNVNKKLRHWMDWLIHDEDKCILYLELSQYFAKWIFSNLFEDTTRNLYEGKIKSINKDLKLKLEITNLFENLKHKFSEDFFIELKKELDLKKKDLIEEKHINSLLIDKLCKPSINTIGSIDWPHIHAVLLLFQHDFNKYLDFGHHTMCRALETSFLLHYLKKDKNKKIAYLLKNELLKQKSYPVNIYMRLQNLFKELNSSYFNNNTRKIPPDKQHKDSNETVLRDRQAYIFDKSVEQKLKKMYEKHETIVNANYMDSEYQNNIVKKSNQFMKEIFGENTRKF